MAAGTFKVGLPILRTSLTLRLVTNMHELMERVEEYKRLEDDQLQAKSKSKTPLVERRQGWNNPLIGLEGTFTLNGHDRGPR